MTDSVQCFSRDTPVLVNTTELMDSLGPGSMLMQLMEESSVPLPPPVSPCGSISAAETNNPDDGETKSVAYETGRDQQLDWAPARGSLQETVTQIALLEQDLESLKSISQVFSSNDDFDENDLDIVVQCASGVAENLSILEDRLNQCSPKQRLLGKMMMVNERRFQRMEQLEKQGLVLCTERPSRAPIGGDSLHRVYRQLVTKQAGLSRQIEEAKSLL